MLTVKVSISSTKMKQRRKKNGHNLESTRGVPHQGSICLKIKLKLSNTKCSSKTDVSKPATEKYKKIILLISGCDY